MACNISMCANNSFHSKKLFTKFIRKLYHKFITNTFHRRRHAAIELLLFAQSAPNTHTHYLFFTFIYERALFSHILRAFSFRKVFGFFSFVVFEKSHILLGCVPCYMYYIQAVYR